MALYHDHAMLEKDGVLIVPTADHKDQFQGFARGYTAVPEVSEHDRHRLLGNAWHLQVVKFILILLLQCQAPGATTAPSLPVGPRESALHFVCRVSRAEPADLGTVQPFRTSSPHRMADDLWDHWQVSHECCHPIWHHPEWNLAQSEPYTSVAHSFQT